MTCYSRQSLQPFPCPPTASRLDERRFANGRMARVRLVPNRPAAEPGFGFLRWLSLRRRRLHRLDLGGLSEHRLRDLGFLDGRGAPPRDPLRD